MNRLFYILVATTLLIGCGLDQMVKKYDTTSFTTTPEILEAHAGKVALSLEAAFQPKYFLKKAIVDFTPVLVYDGGETAFKTITVQGEQATGGEATIFHATGGNFKYSDEIVYTDEMFNSTLELRAVAKLNDKEEILGPINIAQGVIATSTRVNVFECDLANENHEYEHETILEKTATIYFLVNQSNIRTTEKSDDDIKELKAFAKNGYKTHSIEIMSYASPEGTVNLNDNVSDKRMKSTVNYTKQLLRSLRVDGARDDDLYTLTSVGEDWVGFENLVEASDMKDKGRINRIVNSIEDVELREERIRDLSEVYDAIEDDILPQLRKATIIIKSYEPKRTDQEIAALSITNPEELDVKELLFSATLTEDWNTTISIYKKAVELHNDWRGYNNIACMMLEDPFGELDSATYYLNLAEEIGGRQSNILTNKGIVALRAGKLDEAQKLFNEANTTENNQAILDIMQAEYAKAARFYKGSDLSPNAVLANILNGNNDLRDESAYMNAIAAARGGNNDEAIMWLTKEIEDIENLGAMMGFEEGVTAGWVASTKEEMATDLEFINLRENEDFINLTK